MDLLQVALLGLSDVGGELADAVRRQTAARLAVVADRDRERAADLAGQVGAAAFDDYRRVIVEAGSEGLDALFVALPPDESEEYIRLAAKHGCAVFAVPPIARRFDTMAELADVFEQADCPLVVGRTWQPEPAYRHLNVIDELVGYVFAAAVDVTCPADGVLGWQGDARRAGGGVLLCCGYQPVDILVSVLGVPDEVVAAQACARPPGQARPYDTEDAMSLTCRYADDRCATVTCRRTGPSDRWSVTLYGARGTMLLTADALTVRDAQEQPVLESRVETGNRLEPAVTAFVTALSAGSRKLASTAAEHLGTMAAISAAYLSVKTGQPESPRRFLELRRLSER